MQTGPAKHSEQLKRNTPAIDWSHWEPLFEKRLIDAKLNQDPAHDLAHVSRVVMAARHISKQENANEAVVIPAAWLHDLVNVPKNDARRTQASQLSAQAAIEFLDQHNYPSDFFQQIYHAIEAHSYSAGITPLSLEAQIVQDADRLDALGAIGVARCFAVSGKLSQRFYDPNDPFAHNRQLNDQVNTLDHFHEKLFKIVKTLHTSAGRAEGHRRIEFIKFFLNELEREIHLIG